MSGRSALGLAISVGLLVATATSCGARSDIGLGFGVTDDDPREPLCGDGVVDAGEACDDANGDDDDACVACDVARCGDGFVQRGIEPCDAGDGSGPACTGECALPTCGDGVVDGGEECDGGEGCNGRCLRATCGDGVVQADEECDDGAANDDGPAAYLVQDGRVEPLQPYVGRSSVTDYYDYRSASAHTGLEAVDQSNVFLYLDPTEPGAVALITLSGIDRSGGGPAEGRAHVVQTFDGLPDGAYVALSDDRPEEFDAVSRSRVLGDWGFHDNTDGGVIGGLPLPGDYAVTIQTRLDEGIASWGALDPTRERRVLQPGSEAILVVRSRRSSCRTDCTAPRCNDGILDAGEVCDDGNPDAGDGCAPDCLGP